MWYRRVIGGNLAPIVDTWWQTETGAIMIAPLPGVTATKPGSAQVPMPGIAVDVVDELGASVPHGHGGYLVIREPWPSMLRGIWGDNERYKDTYWSRFDSMYFAGDGAKWDDDGDVWLLGRVDDVMNVSGHRLSTTEIESALVSHPSVAEAAVVGAADETTGQAVVAFVILRGSAVRTHDIVTTLRNHVGKRDRADRQAQDHPGGARTAQDPLGQDHAPPAQGCGRRPRGWRLLNPGRQHRHEPDRGVPQGIASPHNLCRSCCLGKRLPEPF